MMLARNEAMKPIAPALAGLSVATIEREYSGFPWWVAMLVEPNREQRSAERLSRVDVHVFLPTFSKVVRRRGGVSHRRQYAVLPGMLLAPEEFLAIRDRERVMDWARVRGFVRAAGCMARFPKEQVEIIREIEAKLNTEEAGGIAASNGSKVEAGAQVRFINDVYAAFFGDGLVVSVVSRTRIGVEVAQLFGGKRTVFVPASEIEVM